MVKKTSSPSVTFNVVSHPDKVLCKTLQLDDLGNLVKQSGARIPQGCYVTTHTDSLETYVNDVCKDGHSKYALPANVALGEKVPLTTKELSGLDSVDRSAATMRFVEGPAVVTLDHDPSRYGHSLPDPESLWAILENVFPRVFHDGVSRGSYYSSGSYIYGPDGREYAGAKGHHTALAVPDATDIPRFGDALFQRLWLARYGYIFITADGKMLLRTIFDAKVLEPQQPIFAGGAHCQNGLIQKRPAPEFHGGAYLDTKALKSLSPDELKEYRKMVKLARAARKSEADTIRRHYQKREVDRLVQNDIPEARARNIVESRLAGILIGQDGLRFAEQGETTVAGVLSDPGRFNECSLHDPLEPDYGGSSTAMFFSNESNGSPVVFSHAHGGRTFLLRHDEQSLTARLQGMPVDEMNEAWTRLLAEAQLRPDAEERILQIIKQSNGVSLKVLRGSLNAERRERVVDEQGVQDPGLVLARRTLEIHYKGGEWLVRTQDGSFWRYTGTHWVPTTDKVLAAEVHQVAEENWGELVGLYMSQGHQAAPSLANMVSLGVNNLGNLVTRPGDPLRLSSRRPSVINLTNGELWLEADGVELRPHQPSSYLTACADIAYDPDAKAPNYERALRGMLCEPGGIPFPDQDEMFRHVNELLGYVCQASRWLKLFILIVGPGDNGKTQLAKLLHHILGIDAISHGRLSGVDEEGGRFATARLVGKLALLDDDADHNYLLPDGFLKKIAEEKPMTAERKFRDEFAFIAQVVVLILANSWPRSKDLSRGMRTRAQVLYLPRSFHKSSETSPDDPDIQRPELWAKVIRDELPGVLNLLIAGYYRIKARGGLLPPPSAARAFDDWWSETNLMTRFIREACMPIAKDKPGCTTTVFKQVFDHWANANKVQDKNRPALNSVKAKMEELGYRIGHGNKGTTIYGLRVTNAWISKCMQSAWGDEVGLLQEAIVANEESLMTAKVSASPVSEAQPIDVVAPEDEGREQEEMW